MAGYLWKWGINPRSSTITIMCRLSSSSQSNPTTIRLLHQILWPWNVILGLVEDMALWANVCLFVSLVKVKWLTRSCNMRRHHFPTPKSLFMRIRQFGCFFRATVLRYLPYFQIHSAVRQQRQASHETPRKL